MECRVQSVEAFRMKHFTLIEIHCIIVELPQTVGIRKDLMLRIERHPRRKLSALAR